MATLKNMGKKRSAHGVGATLDIIHHTLNIKIKVHAHTCI